MLVEYIHILQPPQLLNTEDVPAETVQRLHHFEIFTGQVIQPYLNSRIMVHAYFYNDIPVFEFRDGLLIVFKVFCGFERNRNYALRFAVEKEIDNEGWQLLFPDFKLTWPSEELFCYVVPINLTQPSPQVKEFCIEAILPLFNALYRGRQDSFK